MQKKKNSLKWLFILIVLVIAGFFVFNVYAPYLKSPVDPNGKSVAFVVKKGETASEVADDLENKGFIRSAWVFKNEFKATGDDKLILAGDYKLSPAMSLSEIINNFKKGSMDNWVTLLEGWRIEEMAQKLSDELGVKSDDFLKLAKEGYMFPDTYLFNPDATAQTIADTMRANFDRKYDDDLKKKIRSKGLTEEQGVILASLVEREARSDKVRTEVAGIILKRFKMGMKLDIDSTVRYAKDSHILKTGKKVAKYWEAIFREDYTSVISPYNTYLNNGLPPGPICNPSLSSLQAVANADPNTTYLYYFHDSQGNSYYAKTLEEHNANVANYR